MFTAFAIIGGLAVFGVLGALGVGLYYVQYPAQQDYDDKHSRITPSFIPVDRSSDQPHAGQEPLRAVAVSVRA